MRAIDPAHFPNVVAALREAGLDPMRELIPVAPAAHYMMGGIVADLHAHSTLPGLYAVGESSCTGLHGANRLASNSLSECFVFSRRAVLHALSTEEPSPSPPASPAELEALRALPSPSPGTPVDARRAVARRRHRPLAPRVFAACSTIPTRLARLLARSALARTESRGAHQRLDHPEPDPALINIISSSPGDGDGAWQTWA